MTKLKWERRDVVHPDCSFDPKGDPFLRGRAKQEFRDDCDINNLIAKYTKLGVWPSGGLGIYEDSVEWPKDLAEAFAIAERAQASFDALPPEVRRRLGNDPRRLAELTDDDLADVRRYYERQAGPPPGDGVEGGTPSVEAKPPKKKSKTEDSDQE